MPGNRFPFAHQGSSPDRLLLHFLRRAFSFLYYLAFFIWGHDISVSKIVSTSTDNSERSRSRTWPRPRHAPYSLYLKSVQPFGFSRRFYDHQFSATRFPLSWPERPFPHVMGFYLSDRPWFRRHCTFLQSPGFHFY